MKKGNNFKTASEFEVQIDKDGSKMIILKGASVYLSNENFFITSGSIYRLGRNDGHLLGGKIKAH